MLVINNLEVSFGSRVLFKDVNLKFYHGNCYGVIGANGAGKSTFLKVLSGELESTKGEIITGKNERMAVLEQNQFAYDEFTVLETVIMGHKKLYEVKRERDELYEKSDFREEDGIRVGELEGEFASLGGYEAESSAAILLKGLGISDELHEVLMKDLEGGQKVRVLLAQALFGEPDILILDEPTNHLDLESIKWLEEFLINFPNTVIVVSHDRHFLNQVCTHIVDIDYAKMQLYTGNYDFWYESSQIASKQMRDDKKKSEEKIAELKAFIQRFSSNAAKSKQATSRKKLIEKIKIEDIKPSSRKFPYINFKCERALGKNILRINKVSKEVSGEVLLNNFNLTVDFPQKIVFLGSPQSASAIFEIISGEEKKFKGSFEWGVTTKIAYFPKDNNRYFKDSINLIDWLREYSFEKDETYIRGFLGRMLFIGDEALKSVNVLSGGERVRCMLAKMMLSGANVLIMDEPTNHLDLESITALNNGLASFDGLILFTSHDHQFIETIAKRIIEFTPNGIIDREMNFTEYLESSKINSMRAKLYGREVRLKL